MLSESLAVTATASATQTQLARQIQFLKVENRILRIKVPKRITIIATELKRPIRFASRLGRMLRHLASIVTPDTVLRWMNAYVERLPCP